MVERVFKTDKSGLLDALNDAVIESFLSEYRTALRVAENEELLFARFGNDRMERLMNEQAAHYRARIAEMEARQGVQS